MRKTILSKILKSTSLVALTMPVFVSLAACGNSYIDVQKIDVVASQEWATSGSKITFTAITEPEILSQTDVAWEITKNPYPGITISENGIVTIPEDLLISKSNTLVVTASSKVSASIRGEATVFVVPVHSDELAGFEDNKISYVGRDNKISSVDIMLKSPKTYITTKPIDIWDGLSLTKPKDWDSIIKFVPIIRGGAVKMMNFMRLKESTTVKSCIAWDDGYTDGQFVSAIPLFHGTNHKCIEDSLVVKFACDPEASLTIKFNVWKQQSSTSNVSFDYVSTQMLDKHDVVEVQPNVYQAKCFCPEVDRSKPSHSGLFSQIYIHRDKYEFLDLNFKLDVVGDERITSRIKIDYAYIKEERGYDNFPSYVMELRYTFDLEKMSVMPELDGTELFVLSAVDPWLSDRVVSTCTFVLEWE